MAGVGQESEHDSAVLARQAGGQGQGGAETGHWDRLKSEQAWNVTGGQLYDHAEGRHHDR